MPESKPAKKKVLTNREFASQDEKFQASCKVLEMSNTPRQASKYRNGRGAAYIISLFVEFHAKKKQWLWNRDNVTPKEFLQRHQQGVTNQ